MRNRQTFGIRLQAVRQTRGPNLYDLHCRHATLPHLQDGVTNSEKAYFIYFYKNLVYSKTSYSEPMQG